MKESREFVLSLGSLVDENRFISTLYKYYGKARRHPPPDVADANLNVCSNKLI